MSHTETPCWPCKPAQLPLNCLSLPSPNLPQPRARQESQERPDEPCKAQKTRYSRRCANIGQTVTAAAERPELRDFTPATCCSLSSWALHSQTHMLPKNEIILGYSGTTLRLPDRVPQGKVGGRGAVWSICGDAPNSACFVTHSCTAGMTPRDRDRQRTTASAGTAAHLCWKWWWDQDHHPHSKGMAKLLLPPHLCLQHEHTQRCPSRLPKYQGARCLAGNLFMLP